MNTDKDTSFDPFPIWEKTGVYKIEENTSKPKWFQIFAYPGPSGFLHVGTLRSYTYPDVIAKFKRFTGHNVYFPAGIHASGLPAVQFSEKVRSGKYNEYLKINECNPEIIDQFQTPEGVVYFFRNNYFSIWKQMGFFINEETGIPTTIDPGYKKFIEWQFRILYDKGYLIQKEYISSFCPNDGPVAIDTAETDLSTGGSAIIIEKKVLYFSFTHPININNTTYNNISIIMATESINSIFLSDKIFFNSSADYSIIQYNNQYFIISTDCIPNIKHIFTNFTIITTFSNDHFKNISIKNIFTEKDVDLIEDSNFKKGIGTGFEFNISSDSKDSFDKEKYNKKISSSPLVFSGYFFTEQVICRCGEPVQIRFVPNQWFIKYSDTSITNETINFANNKMKIYPVSFAKEIPKIISWFTDRPCVRTGSWLGTNFPIPDIREFKDTFIIEPIADSTIYPMYYFISKYINKKSIDPSSLNDDFFSFVFEKIGSKEDVQRTTGISTDIIESVKKDFEFWYPLDFNFGGKEHKTVHFPVFMKMHAIMFPEKYWPRGIFVNWWVMQDVKNKTKIGKSKGGAGPVFQILKKYSPDAIRLYYCHAASPHVDCEWSEDRVFDYQQDITRIKAFIYSFFISKKSSAISFTSDLTEWLIYSLKSYFVKMFDYLENFDFRKMTQICFYSIPNTFQRYINRDGVFTDPIYSCIYDWLKYIAMITPFMAEEVNIKINKSGSIFKNENILKRPIIKYKPSVIEEEDFIDNVITDIIKIKKVIKGKDDSQVYIFTHEQSFTSTKSESNVLSSATSYIIKKTGSKPVINPSGFPQETVSKIKPRKPQLLFL